MDDHDHLNGRSIVIWRGQEDPVAATCELSDALAKAAALELFNIEGGLLPRVAPGRLCNG